MPPTIRLMGAHPVAWDAAQMDKLRYAARYEIHVRGRLGETLLVAFPGLHATLHGNETVFAGPCLTRRPCTASWPRSKRSVWSFSKSAATASELWRDQPIGVMPAHPVGGDIGRRAGVCRNREERSKRWTR